MKVLREKKCGDFVQSTILSRIKQIEETWYIWYRFCERSCRRCKGRSYVGHNVPPAAFCTFYIDDYHQVEFSVSIDQVEDEDSPLCDVSQAHVTCLRGSFGGLQLQLHSQLPVFVLSSLEKLWAYCHASKQWHDSWYSSSMWQTMIIFIRHILSSANNPEAVQVGKVGGQKQYVLFVLIPEKKDATSDVEARKRNKPVNKLAEIVWLVLTFQHSMKKTMNFFIALTKSCNDNFASSQIVHIVWDVVGSHVLM